MRVESIHMIKFQNFYRFALNEFIKNEISIFSILFFQKLVKITISIDP